MSVQRVPSRARSLTCSTRVSKGEGMLVLLRGADCFWSFSFFSIAVMLSVKTSSMARFSSRVAFCRRSVKTLGSSSMI